MNKETPQLSLQELAENYCNQIQYLSLRDFPKDKEDEIKSKQDFVDWFFSQKPYWPTPHQCYDWFMNNVMQPPVSGKEVEEVAKIVDYCISKLDTELLKSRQEFHRLVAIKECIKSYPTPIKETVTDGVEFADWKDNNYIKHPNGYYSKFNDGSFGKSHLTPKFHTLTELYTLFQKSKTL